MADAFSGIRLKRARAWDQINGLKPDFISFLEEHPYTARVHFDNATGILTASVHIERSPDPMWGVRIGEIIHDLRSALDHAIWELVILALGRPPDLPTKNQFPIFKSKELFRDRGIPEQLRCVHQSAVTLIESEQPWFAGDGPMSPLWHLHELSNIDKHRTLHVTGALLKGFKFDTSPLKFGLTRHALEIRSTGPMQQDAVLARFQLRHDPGGNIVTEWPFETREIKGHLAIDVAFDQGTPAVGWWLVFPTLVEIANRTDRILKRIANDLFRIEL